MKKEHIQTKSYRSARSGRGKSIVLAPPFLVFALFCVSILLQIPAGYIIHKISFTWGMLINQFGTLLIPVIVVIKFFDLTSEAVVPFKKIEWPLIVLSVAMILSLAVITDYLVYLTELVAPVKETLDEAYSEIMKTDGFFSFVHKFLILCILPSVCEEIFFRGFCQTGLQKYYGRTPAIVITAGLFAIAHLSPWYTHLYFLLGIFLSWLFATSGSLWIPIACHVINNSWTFVSHVMQWNLPLKARGSAADFAIVGAMIVVLTVSVWLWRHILAKKQDSKKSPERKFIRPMQRPVNIY